MFLLNVHGTEKGDVVAACDADVLGEEFSDEKRRLAVDEGFYGGEEAEIVEIVAALEDCHTANLVGDDLIAALVEADALAESEVVEIGGVKHAQLFRV